MAETFSDSGGGGSDDGGSSEIDSESLTSAFENLQDNEEVQRMKDEVRRFKQNVRDRMQESEPQGLDGGEPVSGVNGSGDPRTQPDDPQEVEGPGKTQPSEDGMGGSVQAPRGAQRAVDQTPTDGMGSGEADSTLSGTRGIESQTPNEQANLNANLQIEEQQEQEARRNRTLEDATPGEGTASAPGAGQQQQAGIDLGGYRLGDGGQLIYQRPNATGSKAVSDDLTQSGGFLSEDQEEGLRNASREFAERKNEAIENFAGDNDGTLTNAGESFAKGVTDLANVPAAVGGAETAIEVAQNTPRVASDRGIEETAGTFVAGGRSITYGAVDSTLSDPARALGGAVAGFGVGAVAGKGLGIAGRATSDRIRTAGGTRVDATDLTNQGTVDFFGGRNTDGSNRFPGAQDPGTYRTDPASAVSKQAEDFTPESVRQAFEQAGVDDGVVLKKGVDTDPDGPGATGFKTQEGDFESPGGFVGPELSPNFLRLSGRSSFSLRPGLPTIRSSKPTGVLAKTDVRNSRSSNLDDFNREVLDAEGDTTAITKPSSEVSTGEIEAVIPPEASFTEVTSRGPIGQTARRLGIGSDFYTELGGRRVPLRTVAPEGRRTGAGGPDGPDTDFVGSLDRTVTGSIDDFSRGVGDVTDRPIPVAPAGGGGSSGTSSTIDFGSDGSFFSSGGGASSEDFGVSSSGGSGSGGSGTSTGGGSGVGGSGGSGSGGTSSPPSIFSPPSGPTSSPPSSGPTSGPPSTPPTGPPSTGGGGGQPPSIGPPITPPGTPYISTGGSETSKTPPPPPTGGGGGGGGGFIPDPKPDPKEDFGFDLGADEDVTGFVATAKEQEFTNRIGSVDDILGP